ncbi:dienelactone hydrolase family protein [Paenibacillus sp. HJGM_3]|uniref:dienelactone hydrolase family protein n=1 Tax=Paenibacillus sp. HJGM_3 TaxID=3379816 RepID=UPI00385CAA66
MESNRNANSGVTGRRELLYALLGRLPDRNRPIGVDLVSVEERPSCYVERLTLELNGEQPVPAYFLRPKREDGPHPLVVYHHSHGGRYTVGKEELFVGAPYLHAPYYGEALTREGYCVLAIDAWGFGERSGRKESAIFKEMLWHGRSMLGMMLYDSLRALDYAAGRPDVDPSRIGTIGMSMGSTMAFWLAALDPRVRVTVDICCMTDYQALIEAEGLDLHGLYYYVPDLLTHFTTADIQELIIPRPHLCQAGDRDSLTPAPGLDRVDRQVKEAYAAAGVPEAWTMSRYDVTHEETGEMREETLAYLRRWL